ncbi:uncharacterized protein isoform X2 [Musca autumnalis]|uniref:uncharacterized protein isoform X1 n=1 Tax=Musca autumnalis TaxID=221902 RepID=UPI003CEB4D65
MKDFPCMNDEQIQSGQKLCEAVRRHPCLYDPLSSGYQMRNMVNSAWKAVAKECNDTASNCRFRWKTIRSSFTRSFRKFGTSSQYYLYEYLDFLVPHMSLMEKNDESIGGADEMNPLQLDKEEDSSHRDDISLNDTDTTKSADEHFKNKLRRTSSVIELDPDSNGGGSGGELAPNSTTDDDQSKRKLESPPPLPRLQQIQPTPSPNQSLNSFDDCRPTRIRKPPKRIYVPELETEMQQEKRPRRIMERRKSLGGLVLREFMYKNNISLDEPAESPQREEKQKKAAVSFCDEPEIDIPKKSTFNEVKVIENLENNWQQIKSTSDAEVFAKPEMLDASTETERMEITDEKAIQSNEEPRTLDDEFLDSLRPQIRIMNFRQKINFKQRVYLALMDVLDDAKNFPNDEDDIVELPPPMAKHFESATSGELRLMRELVSLVKAAKVSSEVVDANKKVTIVRSSSETNLTKPNRLSDPKQHSPTTNGLEELLGDDERETSSPNPTGGAKSHDSLGIPRHILHKAVKVTGQSGGTLLAQNGDKRRIYRIYPKNQVPNSGTGGSTTSSASSTSSMVVGGGEKVVGTHQSSSGSSSNAGTFFVTPSKPPLNRAPTYIGPMKKMAPLNNPCTTPMRGTAIQYPKIVPKQTGAVTSTGAAGNASGSPAAATSSSTTSPMLPPSTTRSPVLSGSSPHATSTPQGQKISISTHVPSANIFRRRYSICGPAPNSSAGVPSRVITTNGGGTSASVQQSRHSLQPLQNIQQMRQGLQQHLQQMRQGMQQHQQQQQQHQPFKLSQQPIKLASSSPGGGGRPPPQMQQIRPVPIASISSVVGNVRSIAATSTTTTTSTTNSSSPFQILQPRSLNSSAMDNDTRSNSPRFNQDSNSTDGPTSSSTTTAARNSNNSPEGPSADSFSQNANDIPVLETAGTIAADSFEPEFPKPPFIKDEPQD